MTNEKTQTIEEVLSTYDEKILALAQYLDIDLTPDFDAYVDEEASEEEQEEQKKEAIQAVIDELDNIQDEGDNLYSYYNQEYNVFTDSEADDRWEEELNYYIDECIFPELPDNLVNYFDEEAWKHGNVMHVLMVGGTLFQDMTETKKKSNIMILIIIFLGKIK